ncbi:A24 family peptidase [Paraburkholderia acidipaludis]|uniref:A24 family peptidase n=1 Tax=Paraburkholderia acidipaludis TaxID=660537 RepID=UPI00047F9B39|nr:prepilin peptidase [Paraburkholderia acidipaludis]
MTLTLLSGLVFGAWTVAVAIGDCCSRRVPNALVVAGLCAALAASLLHAGPARIGPGQALGATLVSAAALMPCFVLGVMGAGDVKVFAVLGAWCGLHLLFDLWIVASIAAGVHAAATLIALRWRSSAARSQGVQIFTVGGRRGTPYAAYLTMLAFAWLAWQFALGSTR